MNALVYDLEIVRGIPKRGEDPVPGIDYCEGWGDHENMGISVLCAYDYAEDRYRVFCKDNWADFVALTAFRRPLVGFNSIRFDNAVIRHGPEEGSLGLDIQESYCYDVLREVWRAAGLGPNFSPKTHGGFRLDDMARVNLDRQKTGEGALAPVQWQRGEVGAVIDYCMEDVRLTKLLFDFALERRPLRSPVDGRELMLRHPSDVVGQLEA